MVALEGLHGLDRAAVIAARDAAIVVAQLLQAHLQHVHVLALAPAGERAVGGRPVFPAVHGRGRRHGQVALAQGLGVELALEGHGVLGIVFALVDGDDRARGAVVVDPLRVGDVQAHAAVRGRRAQGVKGLDGERCFIRGGIEHGVERVGAVDAGEVLRVGIPGGEIAPAGALAGHDGRAQRRGVLLRAGGADHLAHEHGVLPVFIVGVGAHNLVGHVDHQGVAGRRGRGRGARRRAGGHGIAGKEQLLRLPSGHAVGGQAVVLLEIAHGAARDLVVAAGDLRAVKAQLLQAALQLLHQRAAVAVLELSRVDKRLGRSRRHGRDRRQGRDGRICRGIRHGRGGGRDGRGGLRGARRLLRRRRRRIGAVRRHKADLTVVIHDDLAVLVLKEDDLARRRTRQQEKEKKKQGQALHGDTS